MIALKFAHSAISIAIGQTITLSAFADKVPPDFPNGLAATMVATDPTGSMLSALSPENLHILRSIWNLAVSRTMFLALAMICAAVPCTLAMEWLNAKKIAVEREKEKGEGQNERVAHDLSDQTVSKTSL